MIKKKISDMYSKEEKRHLSKKFANMLEDGEEMKLVEIYEANEAGAKKTTFRISITKMGDVEIRKQ